MYIVFKNDSPLYYVDTEMLADKLVAEWLAKGDDQCYHWREVKRFTGDNSVEFNGILPPGDGFIWYVDIEYPLPLIGYVSHGKFFDSWSNEITNRNHIRFGPWVEPIDCKCVRVVW